MLYSNRKKLLIALSKHGGVCNFSLLERETGLKGAVMQHHLNSLISRNIIDIPKVKGTYNLRFKTPLCYVFEARNVVSVYVGLLGRRNSKVDPEPRVAQRLLAAQGIDASLHYVLTSPEAAEDWKSSKLPYQWIFCYGEEIFDIDAIQEKVRPQLEALLREYSVVMDCTSGTKPATIAYYQLALQYLVPCVYIAEERKKVELKWLISRETIKQELVA
jgi:hypothetical protein